MGAKNSKEEILSDGTAPPEETGYKAQPEEILSEGTAHPEETGYKAQPEEILSEGIAPLEETGYKTQPEEILSQGTAPHEETQSGSEAQPDSLVSETAPDPVIATNKMDSGDETGQGEGDVHEEQSQEIDLLQAMPYKTPRPGSESASDPAIATNETDPGDETGLEERVEEQVPPSQETDMLPQVTPPNMTPQHDSDPMNADSLVLETAPDPVIATNEMDSGDETGQGEDVHEEQVPPSQEIDLLQAIPYKTPRPGSESAPDPVIATNETDPGDETVQEERVEEQVPPSQETDMLPQVTPPNMTPQHDSDPVNAAGIDLTTIQPQTSDPERAKTVAAKDTLQKHSYNLSKCIKSSSLASGLFSQKIINSEDYERASNPVYGTERERALILLVKVIQQLERKPKWFNTVCDILKKEGVSIKELKRDYQRKYDELTQDSAGQTQQGVVGSTASTGAKSSGILTSDSETDSEVDSNPPSVETQGPALLQQACRSGSSMTVQHTLANSMQPYETIPTENNETLLHLALNQGYCNLFDVLCSHSTDADVNAQDKDGQTPLHLACHKSDACSAEMLLRHSTGCLMTKNKDKDTPLHIACHKGTLDVVDVLLKYKPDPHAQNMDGYTPLHLACSNVEVAKRLVSYEHSTVDGIDKNQNTPLHLACQEADTDATIVDTLLNKRIDKYNSEGFTTLHLASSCGNFVVVKRLLKHCRTHRFVNWQNKNGDTALHLACQKGFVKVVLLLLKSKYKAERDMRNHANKTPIDIARENQHTAVVQCLDPPPPRHFKVLSKLHQKFKKSS